MVQSKLFRRAGADGGVLCFVFILAGGGAGGYLLILGLLTMCEHIYISLVFRWTYTTVV